jgi:GNAT superfamily N-acetyltransferase
MAEIFEQFIPTLDHPWTAPTVRLIHEEILGHPPLPPEEVAEQLDTYIFPDFCAYYGLARDFELVAMGSLRSLGKSETTIDDLVVRPDMRGRHYGERVLDELETIARTAGAAVMKVTPFYNPKQARDSRSFYARYGYRQTPKSHWIKNL